MWIPMGTKTSTEVEPGGRTWRLKPEVEPGPVEVEPGGRTHRSNPEVEPGGRTQRPNPEEVEPGGRTRRSNLVSVSFSFSFVYSGYLIV